MPFLCFRLLGEENVEWVQLFICLTPLIFFPLAQFFVVKGKNVFFPSSDYRRVVPGTEQRRQAALQQQIVPNDIEAPTIPILAFAEPSVEMLPATGRATLAPPPTKKNSSTATTQTDENSAIAATDSPKPQTEQQSPTKPQTEQRNQSSCIMIYADENGAEAYGWA